MHIKTSDLDILELGFYNYSINWGVHIAGLYETDEERDEIIINYLAEGARKKDLQLFCPYENTVEEFEQKMIHNCPACENMLHDESIFQIFTTKGLYYPDGIFSPKAMDDGLNSFYENSQKNGHRNIRATAEMAWALEAIPGIEHLMAYESRLNYFIPGKPWISICMYNLKKFDGSTIMKVLKTHPYTISKGILMENPYYENPDIWLKDNAPQFLPENIK
jgi:hypothetical protein